MRTRRYADLDRRERCPVTDPLSDTPVGRARRRSAREARSIEPEREDNIGVRVVNCIQFKVTAQPALLGGAL